MKNYLRSWLGMLVLLVSTTPVAAAAYALPADGTSSPRRETLWGLPRDDPAIAIGAIVVVLILFAFIAWIAARVGDKS